MSVIVDIRVGCIAVYEGPKLNCLDGISYYGGMPMVYYHRGGKMVNGVWTVKRRHIIIARLIGFILNMNSSPHVLRDV